MSEAAWDNLRSSAKALEAEIDTQIIAYSKVANSLQTTSLLREDETAIDMHDDRDRDTEPLLSSTTHRADALGSRLRELLAELRTVNEAMAAQFAGNGGVGGGLPSQRHVLSRHREILRDYTQEFDKIASNVRHVQESMELLSASRRDYARTDEENMWRERGAIDGAGHLADDILGQAAAAHAGVREDTATFSRITGTVGEVLGRFPAIQNMMHKAQMRKKKNMYILSCVIATCIIIILLFIIG